MKNTEYKCLCCGWQGKEEMNEASTIKSQVTAEELDICPVCGCMDVHDVLELEKQCNKNVVSPM